MSCETRPLRVSAEVNLDSSESWNLSMKGVDQGVCCVANMSYEPNVGGNLGRSGQNPPCRNRHSYNSKAVVPVVE